MTWAQPDHDAELDALVSEMLEMGPNEVSCPEGVDRQDFHRVQLIIDEVVRMYHPGEKRVPWQPGIQRGNQGRLIDFLRNRDYRGAHGFLAAEADFLPA